MLSIMMNDTYWKNFSITQDDIDVIYSHLLDIEIPQTPAELLGIILADRIEKEKINEKKREEENGAPYLPKNEYKVGDPIVFSNLDNSVGTVTKVRDANSFDLDFKVITVIVNEEEKEFAAGLEDHILNEASKATLEDDASALSKLLNEFGQKSIDVLVDSLRENDDFTYIGGKWFPSALLIDVNIGLLNLAEAVLDMNGGGPMYTNDMLEQIGFSSEDNPKLAEFSLDLAMQEDPRFDEVGTSGEMTWYLERLEPEAVLNTPIYLQYQEVEVDRDLLTEDMVILETEIDDELSNVYNDKSFKKLTIPLIFPHWRSGTLPITNKTQTVFPTALESERVRFVFIDEETRDEFEGWVVRKEGYVSGLSEWYESKNAMPGSIIQLQKGSRPGDVVISVQSYHSSKDWVRTAVIGSDGGIVYATLKQPVSTNMDAHMFIAMPGDVSALDEAWKSKSNTRKPLENLITEIINDLARLNPQYHVHAIEIYSAINAIRRCPPAPMLAALASDERFVHVGDFYYRYENSEA